MVENGMKSTKKCGIWTPKRWKKVGNLASTVGGWRGLTTHYRKMVYHTSTILLPFSYGSPANLNHPHPCSHAL